MAACESGIGYCLPHLLCSSARLARTVVDAQAGARRAVRHPKQNHQETNMKKLIAGLALGVLAMAGTAYAQADDYPSRPVKFIVPLGPGSGADTNTRALADRFQKATGVPALVENRP